MRIKPKRRLVGATVVLVLLALTASAAWLAITNPPTSPFNVPGDAAGNPMAFLVTANGFQPGSQVYVEQCDGQSPSTPGWGPAQNCDLGSSPTPVLADANGVATFNPNNPNNAFTPFKGESPQTLFNCLAPGQASPANGLPDYTNCQVRVSTSDTAVTGDQSFFTITLPNPLPPSTTTTTTIPQPAEPDAYKCYKVKDLKTPKFVALPSVSLADQFETKNSKVTKPATLCNPVSIDGSDVADPTAHLVCYTTAQAAKQAKFVKRNVETVNDLGTSRLQATAQSQLCVPSTKNGVASPLEVDHFKCYKIKDLKNPVFAASNHVLQDQFETKNTTVKKVASLCNPVDKNGEGILNASNHLVCYQITQVAKPKQDKFVKQQVTTDNQFGPLGLEATAISSLCMPSSKQLLP